MSNHGRYIVTGIHPVCGAQPGERFSANLPPEQERALIQGGAIRKIVPPRPRRKGS